MWVLPIMYFVYMYFYISTERRSLYDYAGLSRLSLLLRRVCVWWSGLRLRVLALVVVVRVVPPLLAALPVPRVWREYVLLVAITFCNLAYLPPWQ